VVYYRSRTRSGAENVEVRFQNAVWLAANPMLARDSAASNPEALMKEFKELSEQTEVERIAALATVEVGDRYAVQAFAAGQVGTPADREDLEADATSYYRRAIEKFPKQFPAVAKAHLGLARLAEGNQAMDAARSEYRAVTALKGKVPSLLVEWAELSLAKLDKLDLRPMATTAPAAPTTEPATRPSAAPATRPSAEPATQPARKKPGPTTRPVSKTTPKP